MLERPSTRRLVVLSLTALLAGCGWPDPSPSPTPTPSTVPTPTPTPTPAGSITVSTIPALLSALDDNGVTEIVVTDGTYVVAPAGTQAATSLWIGSRFADRTKPVLVRAETKGGVTFDGGGMTGFSGVAFEEGAHDQTWDGFNFDHGEATSTGVIMFGGYAGRPPAHHITLRNITMKAGLTGHTAQNDHGIYCSWAASPGVNNILVEDYTVDGTGAMPLSSALHFYHSDAANPNGNAWIVRRMKVTGTYTAVFLWDSSIRNITVEDSTVDKALYNAVRYEGPSQDIILRRVTSTASGSQGFYSSLGTNPPGITFIDTNFDP